MEIDRIEFIAWMERIMDRFDLLKEQIDKAEKRKNSLDGEELLDNQDLMLTFKISARSLQRYRSNGKLPIIPYQAKYTTSSRMYINLSENISVCQ